MVDLPKVPIPDSVTQPVHTSISSSEVAAPYAELAHGLDKVGEKLSEVSVPLAEKAADQAVRTDDAGNLIVDRSPFPMVGDAATAYARRTRMTYAAKMEPQIQTEMLKLRLENPNNPEAFKAAASNYSKELVGNIDDPTLKSSIGTMASTNAAHNYRTSLVETNSASVAEHLQTMQSRIKDINERGALLARQNGTDTPEYQGLSHERETIYKEMGNDPNIKFSPERAALEIKENRDNDVGQAIIGQAQRIYKTKDNLGEAKKFLQDTFWNSDKVQNMTPAKRDHFVAEGLHALANLDAKDHEAISENRQAVSKYLTESQTNPRQWNPIVHDNMIERAEEIGDTKSANELRTQRTMMPMWNDIKQMDGPDSAHALDTLSRGIRPGGPNDKFIEAEAKRVGIDPNVMRRYAQIESSGNPYATTGRYKGLFQLSNEEFAQHGGAGNIFDPEQNTRAAANSLRARADLFKEKYGRDPTATELYLAHNQGDAGLQAHLANPNAPAWLNMLSTGEGRQRGAEWAKKAIWGNIPDDVKKQFPGGRESVTSQDLMNVWQRKVEGQLIPGAPINIHGDAATARLWESTIKEVRTQTGQFAQKSFTVLKQRIESGGDVKPDDVQHFIEMAVSSGRDDLLTQAEPLLKGHDVAASLEPGTSASVFEAQVAAAKNGGVSDVAAQALDTAAKLVKQSNENLQKRPLFEGSQRGQIPPPNQLVTDNQPALVKELHDRDANMSVMRQRNPQLGQHSVVDQDEAVELGNKLTSGDPAQAAQTLKALSTLPDQSYVATMSTPGLKDAVVNMSRSSDPVRFGAAMNTLAVLWKAHPAEFAPIYGENTLDRLMAYRGLQGSLTAEEVIERMQKADDPSTAKARAEIGDQVQKELSAWKPEAVADQLGTSWGITPGFIGRAIGTTPGIPVDSVSAGSMKQDFISTMKALRTYGVPEDEASRLTIERMKSQWKPSEISGGQLMKFAPEAYYPQVGGSHDWMKESMMRGIEAVMGPQFGTPAGAAPGSISEGAVGLNWQFKGLVADAQTEQEVKSGKPPTYQIAITDARGQTQILFDPTSGFTRARWNEQSAKETFAAKQKVGFDTRRQTIEDMRPYSGITGPM